MNEFPSHCFPEPVKNLLDGLEPIVGSRAEFGGLAVLFAGSIVSARVTVEVKKGWILYTNLYSAIVAEKGEAKSPAIKFMCGPIFSHFGKTSAEYLSDLEKWNEKVIKAKQLSRKEMLAAIDMLDDEKPKMPWWGVITDGTVEGIRKVAGENHEAGHPSRIGRYNDELDGWIQSMNKYSEGGDMAFYLQAHDGDIHIKANKGEKSSCPPTTLSLIGTIQPEIFSQAFNGNNTHNGLLDRVMVASPQGKAPEVDPFAEWETDALNKYRDYVLKLLDDLPELNLKIGDDCKDVSREFYKYISRVDAKAKTGAKAKWWQHYFKVIGIMTVLWGEKKVTVKTCELSSELCKYFVACWVRSFKEMNRSDTAKAEARIVKTLKEKGFELTYGDVRKIFNSRERSMVEMAIDNLTHDGVVKLSDSAGANGKPVTMVRLVFGDSDE